VLSLDGTKVAYVVNTPTNPTLQVLTLPIGTQSGTINIPTAPSTTCGAPAPSICSLTLSSSGDSNSSLFVDYSTDTAYVGGDNGWLDKITGAFNATPALAGGLWPVSAGSMFLGSPVYDSITQTVFVGSYDGNLYGFTSGGDGITGSPLALAASAGGSQGLYYAPPIVDSTNHVLYAFYGDNATTSLAGCTSANTCAEVAQVVYYDKTAAKVEFESGAGTPGSASTAVAGTNLAAFLTTNGAATFVIADGAFSYGYFTSFPSTTSTSFLYACGATGISTGVGLQQFGFNGSGQLSATVTQVANITSSTAAEFPCSPATEFYNTSTNTDYLFLSVPVLNEVQSYILPGYGGSSGSMSAAATSATVVGGASGIIVDGADPFLNASSVYFTSELTGTCTDSGNASPANSGIGSASSAICAYKLTQRRLD
jgi:hypothetical protein